MQIKFLFEGKKYITVVVDNLPSTVIKCEDTSNENILKTCETWIKALGLEKTEWHVDVRLK